MKCPYLINPATNKIQTYFSQCTKEDCMAYRPEKIDKAPNGANDLIIKAYCIKLSKDGE